MICYPLDDTDYGASEHGTYLCTRTRGVYSSDSHFAVTPAGGMSVRISAGLGWLKVSEFWGVAVLQDTPITLSVDPADNAMNRIDAVCVRLDKSANNAEIVIKKGSLAVTPSIPSISQNDVMFDEIYISTIFIPAKTTEITQELITDQRANEQLCGVMRDGVTGIPTQTLYDRFEFFLSELQHAIDDVVSGADVMLKVEYDTNNSGVVDDSERLGGQEPSYYASAAYINKLFTQNNMTIYVSTTGNDTTGDGSATNPYRSPQKAISSIPKQPLHEVVISIAAGNYSSYGVVIIENLSGHGPLSFKCPTSGSFAIIHSLKIRNCMLPQISVENIETNNITSDSNFVYGLSGASFHVINTFNVKFNACKTINTEMYAIVANSMSNVHAENCIISNKSVAFYSYGGRMTIVGGTLTNIDTSGGGAKYYSVRGGIMSLMSEVSSPTFKVSAGGLIVRANGTVIGA